MNMQDKGSTDEQLDAPVNHLPPLNGADRRDAATSECREAVADGRGARGGAGGEHR
eukprot:SAG31_NODE_763_length_12265_cov_3.024984_9_plen_56_part_00